MPQTTRRRDDRGLPRRRQPDRSRRSARPDRAPPGPFGGRCRRRLRGDCRGATATEPHVLVTDIRMPPSFNREGIDAAKEVRKRHPGTGVVILSQYDDPEYAVSLLAEGSAGYGYLLKDHIAEGNQLVDAIRAVATGGTALDPAIVEALVRPVTSGGELERVRGVTPGTCGRGQAHKGHRSRTPAPSRGRRRRSRGGVLQACAGSERRKPGSPAAAAPSAPGDRRPGGAGRDALAACCRVGSRRSCAQKDGGSARQSGSR